MILDLLTETQSVWERLKAEKRPIVLYGMGDGAQKILNVFAEKGISAADIFASDEFVRGHSFAGFKVLKLSEVKEKYNDFVVIISFASQRSEVLEKLYELDEVYDTVAPDVPVAGGGLFDFEYLKSHEAALSRVYSLLSDEMSRRVFMDTLNYKISGKIGYLRHSETDKSEAFNRLLKPTPQEHFVDLGAYNGDTVRELLTYTKSDYATITALEPDRRNFKKLKTFCEANNYPNVNLYNAAAWDSDGTLLFEGKAGRNSAISKNQGIETQVRSVDSILDDAPATLIKFDVEGAERQAILGAQKTIRAWRPKMNIAVYHRNEDIFAIPLLLHEICPAYKLYLRHHPYVPAWDTNLYATVD